MTDGVAWALLLISQEIRWERTTDGEFPYRADHNGTDLRLRVNDFPAEPLYTLLVDCRPAADLEDWPPLWIRPPF